MEETTNNKNKIMGVALVIVAGAVLMIGATILLGNRDSDNDAATKITVDGASQSVRGAGWECLIQETDPPQGICEKNGNQLSVIERSSPAKLAICGSLTDRQEILLIAAGADVLILSEAESPWDGFNDDLGDLADNLGSGYQTNNLESVCSTS